MPKRKIRQEVTVKGDIDVTDWSNYKVAELKLELEARGLAKSGLKGNLVARLEASDAGTLPISEATSEAKRTKKMPSPDVEIEGPVASEVVQHQNMSSSGERRLQPFVAEPDEAYKKKLKKVKKERMFMLDRAMSVDRDGYKCEEFNIAGSTGNIYQTTIGRKPKCTCMDARIRGQKCKHICYALIIILKAPNHLCYQTAFLSDELESIFANAPVTRATNLALERNHDQFNADEHSICVGKRKPVDGECPICVFDMDTDENLVWCKASCGQNFHQECFEQWKKSKNGGYVTCVYCRAEWQEDDSPAVKKCIPGSLASLIYTAPKIGSYRNIGGHDIYRQPKE